MLAPFFFFIQSDKSALLHIRAAARTKACRICDFKLPFHHQGSHDDHASSPHVQLA